MNLGNARTRLLASTIIAGMFAAAPAVAQDAAAPVTGTSGVASADGAADAGAGEIIVTGSRIASPTLTSGAPLQIVSSKDIQSTGASNLQDVLQENPVISSPSISRTNSNFATSSGGVATVDLRNLGTARTLVLVDGLRFVSGVPNSQAVDLNSIPTSFIDQVQIVSGGESAIYGSDAVAGVVNIIYKKHFSGVEANVQSGISQYGDDASKQANLTIGGNFNDDRGNVMVYAGYSRDGTVRSADRARTATDQSSLGAETGDINDLFTIDRPVRSSYIPQGTFFCGDSACNGTDGAILGDGSAYPPTQAEKFNRESYRYIAVPVTRYLIASRANYEISSAANVFLDATFARSHVHQQLEPAPADTYSTGTGIFAAEAGQYPIEQRLADGSLFLNPLIPSYIVGISDDSDGDGLRDIAWSRRLTDIGDRTFTSDRETYRIVAGVEGDIAPKWHYKTYINYGRTSDNDTGTGQYNLANFRNALEVIPGTSSDAGALLAPNGQYVICASADARAEGCVPANVYGANTLDPRSAAYIRAPSTVNSYAQQIDTGADLTGSLWDLWGAGPIGVATGVEYRKESSSVKFDALTQTGQNGGNKLPNTAGSFDVVEGYGEIHIPLITDKPFFKDLEARAAGRVSRYSTVGTVYSYNAGGLYSPTPDITFRASVALSTRAPNVGELFSGLSQTFPTGLNDPCVGITATGGGALGDNCRAATGVSANIAENGSFTQTQSDQQGISGYDGGNPNLKQEKGRTITGGVVINPKSIKALRNFSLTVDYTRTKITGAITATDRQLILNQCYQDGDPTYCQFITRRAADIGTNSAGSLEFINRGVVNSGGILTSSIDVTTSYKQDLDTWGSITGTVTYTHLLKGWVKDFPGADKNNFAGEVGAPKDHFLATIDWKIGALTLEYRGNYIGQTYLDDQFVLGLVDSDGTPITNPHDPRARIKAQYLQDLQANFDVGDHFNFYVGVNNLLNKAPPPIYSNLPGDTTGAETDASDYDAIGRRFYAGARVRF
jgi:iron complex outermembrane receptor protein